MKIRHRNYVIVLAAVTILLLFATVALGVDNIQQLNQGLDQTTSAPAKYNVAWDFVKLTIVLALIVGAAWSIIRLFGSKTNARMQGTWLHTVDEVMLGQNRGLVLCEVAGKLYAIGVTEHNINLLFEVDNPQILQDISTGNYNQLQQNQDLLKEWTDRLKNLLGRKEILSPPARDFHTLMEEQVQRLHHLSSSGSSAGKVNEKNGEDN